MNPENLTLLDAQAATKGNSAQNSHREITLKMLAGDHWLGGQGWVGPRLPDTNPLAGEFLANVQRQFMPKNAVKEVARRHIGAVIGRYPIIKLAMMDATAEPNDEQLKEMKEGEGALTAWLDTVRGLGKLQEFTEHLLLGEAHLQNYIPSGELKEGRLLASPDLVSAARRIRLRVPAPGSARVVDDEETGSRYALFKTRTKQGADATEISYLTPDGKTVIRRVEGGAVGPVAADGQAPLPPGRDNRTDALDMGGHLNITQASRDQFLTPTLIRNNWMLNFAKTAILRNAELAAVLERYGIGILPPGEYVKDDSAPGGMRFQPAPDWRPGGANATFFPPQTLVDEEGRTSMAGSAQYGRFEPVKPDALIATKLDAYHDMLDEAAQGHIRMTGDATSSGEARIQAMNDFKVSLYATATSIEAALADHLEMTLAWAASLSGNPGRFRAYRVVVQCRVTAAQPTTEERRLIIEERTAGLRSAENAMSEIGIEDTDQMLAAVKQEQDEAAARGAQAAEGLAKFLDPAKPGGGDRA